MRAFWRQADVLRWLLAAAASAAIACSLVVDTNGLSGGAGAGDGGAGADAAVDAAPPPVDGAAADASNDASGPPGDSGTPDAPLLDAADGSQVFVDDFVRPDGPTIGNGWIQKYPPAFILQSDSVVREYPSATYDFVDNIVYRPTAESLLDVEVSLQVKLNVDPPGYPQVHARVQASTVATAGQLDSYFLYVDNAMSTAYVARQHGGSSGYANVATLAISPPLTTTATYRLRLDVTGANPVVLVGYVEELVGGSWQALQTGSFNDTDSTAITTAGTVGFSGGRPESNGIYSYGGFTRTPL